MLLFVARTVKPCVYVPLPREEEPAAAVAVAAAAAVEEYKHALFQISVVNFDSYAGVGFSGTTRSDRGFTQTFGYPTVASFSTGISSQSRPSKIASNPFTQLWVQDYFQGSASNPFSFYFIFTFLSIYCLIHASVTPVMFWLWLESPSLFCIFFLDSRALEA